MSRLVLSHLSAGYGGHAVVHDINITLESGSVLAVIGPNGAGKSTLIRAVSGILPTISGSVSLDGTDLKHLSTGQRARLMAVVPQGRNLPPEITGMELVTLGRTPHLNWLGQVSCQDEEIVSDAMQHTQTELLAERRLGELSGGEVQRLLLARALAQRTPLLLLDEPTTHLDLAFQVNLLDLVCSMAYNPPAGFSPLAVLLVLHDLNLVSRYASQVALLVSGTLIDSGSPDEVLTESVLSQAYGLPLRLLPTTPGEPPVVVPAAFPPHKN